MDMRFHLLRDKYDSSISAAISLNFFASSPAVFASGMEEAEFLAILSRALSISSLETFSVKTERNRCHASSCIPANFSIE